MFQRVKLTKIRTSYIHDHQGASGVSAHNRRRSATNPSPCGTGVAEGNTGDEERNSCVHRSTTTRQEGIVSLAGVYDGHAARLVEDNNSSPQTCVVAVPSAPSR